MLECMSVLKSVILFIEINFFISITDLILHMIVLPVGYEYHLSQRFEKLLYQCNCLNVVCYKQRIKRLQKYFEET